MSARFNFNATHSKEFSGMAFNFIIQFDINLSDTVMINLIVPKEYQPKKVFRRKPFMRMASFGTFAPYPEINEKKPAPDRIIPLCFFTLCPTAEYGSSG